MTERTMSRRRGAHLGLLGVLAVLGVLLTGCAELTPTELRQIDRGGTSLRPLLDPDSVAIPGTDSEDVIALLGEPDDAEESKPPKRQRPGTVVTMRYDGLEIIVRELRKPTRAFISDMTLTSAEYVTNVPVGVGASRDEIEQVLGEPLETRDAPDERPTDAGSEAAGSEGAPTGEAGARSEAVYALTDNGDRCIVTYEDGRATSVHFAF